MVGKEIVRQKAAEICEDFYRFKGHYGYTDIRINPRAVKSAVKSCLDDALQHKAYHGKNPSPCKYAALLLFWLVKTKPIFLPLDDDTAYADPKYSQLKFMAVNELFALMLAFSLIGVYPKTNIQDKLVYLLYFRDVNPRHLFLTLDLLCSLHPSQLKTPSSSL
jgi:hypothetical protein